MQTTISLIRHGETAWNAEQRWQGNAPVPLNSQGEQQAREAAHALHAANIQRIIASDLARAYRTAEIIAEVVPVPLQTDNRWREVDVGRWQGLSRDEILAWDGAAYAVFRQADYLQRQFPEGEHTRDHIARVSAALEDIAAQYPGEHVLVATHGGSIRAAVYHLTGEILEHIPNGSITQAKHTENAWHCPHIAQAPAQI